MKNFDELKPTTQLKYSIQLFGKPPDQFGTHKNQGSMFSLLLARVSIKTLVASTYNIRQKRRNLHCLTIKFKKHTSIIIKHLFYFSNLLHTQSYQKCNTGQFGKPNCEWQYNLNFNEKFEIIFTHPVHSTMRKLLFSPFICMR